MSSLDNDVPPVAGPPADAGSQSDPYRTTAAPGDAVPQEPLDTDPLLTDPAAADAIPRVQIAGDAFRIGDYEVVGPIGEAGGMGVVYRARHTKLDRFVALKMPLRTDGDVVRFRAEAEAAAQLDHPGIVPIYEVGEERGRPYFSMALVEGGSLSKRVSREGPLRPRDAATLVQAVAEAVHYAHERGVIHRDLKPANILLSANGSPKVTDFGLAKRLETASDLTHTGQVLGTPSYMPPEQARGDLAAIGPTSDVYALGGVLYHALTGRPPFLAATVEATLQLVFDSDPLPPRQLDPQIDRDLETIALKCLEKEPRHRYASAGAVAADLGRFLAGEPILARPTPPWERAWKWARRRPAVAMLTGVSLLTLVSMALGGLFFAQAAEQRAKLARAELKERDALDAGRRQAQESLRRADLALDDGRLQDAEKDLAAARATLAASESLVFERQDMESLAERLAERQRAESAKAASRKRLVSFDAHRDEALFYGTHRFGVDYRSNLRRAAEEARAGLNLFGIDPAAAAAAGHDGRIIAALGDYGVDEQRRIRDRIYELLLAFSESSVRATGAADALAPADAPAQEPVSTSRAAATSAVDMAAAVLGHETAATRLHRAECLAAAGDAAAAEAERIRADAEPAGETAADHFLVGMLLTRPDAAASPEAFTRAKTAYEQALRLDPDHFWAQYALAMLGLRQSRPDMADVHLTACLARRPDFAWAWILRGSSRAILGEHDRAVADFEQSLSLPLEPEAKYVSLVNRAVLSEYPQGHVDAARGLLREALPIMPTDSKALLALARLEDGDGHADEAVALLDEAARIAPQEAAVFRLRGEVQAGRRDFAAAERDLRAAAALDRNVPQSRADHLTALGQVLAQQGKLEAAAGILEESERLADDVPKTHLWRGAVLVSLGRHEKALQAFDDFLQDGGQPNAVFHHHRAICRQQALDFAGAIDDWSRAAELEPSAKHHHARGGVYLAAGNLGIALKDFERAIDLDPDHADAHFGRALALALGGRHADAAAAAERALGLEEPSFRQSLKAAAVFAAAAPRVVLSDEERKRQGPTERQYSIRYLQRAADLLEEAFLSEDPPRCAELWAAHVENDPHFKPLLKEPEFRKLRRKVLGEGGADGRSATATERPAEGADAATRAAAAANGTRATP
jgi:tetratricopeptide (TPR) repeat protein/tRNA A-37 threonylcarbamoyl transferase component Bud32